MKLTVLAPAKINLSLDIVCKRPDGYHDVAMVMQTVSLYDTVTVSDEVDESFDGDFLVTCDKEGIPTDSSNIVCKAAVAFFKYCDIAQKKISIDIKKNIPSQAGLAGGSTDGAAVIMALNRIFDQKLTLEQMCEIGQSVGADVPFCIVGGTQLATGTGTTMSKLPALTKCDILICKPDVNVSTAKAYELSDSKPSKGFLVTDEIVKFVCKRNLRGVAQCLYNEFEAVMQIPEISSIKGAMLKNKALGACMSGSGSAVFGIFLNEKKAAKCKDAMSESFEKLYLCKPITHGCKIV
ncbi:MAG: 4-(cytidine 5'-diphospho)-2-C-methyl-D-erythritol kinase [Ruminococcaceae bacterium]|nr:4-(cytidine 5'-diphospho)-2-C-methyl-D-erythritol kinase [Oscillospiraceae bacterium]